MTAAMVRARVLTIIEMWDRLGADIFQIDPQVVADTPYDDYVIGAGEEEAHRKRAAATPWAASSHYGKELNLMLGGHKHVALIDQEEIAAWIPYLDDGRFIAVHDNGFLDCYIVMRRSDARFLEPILSSMDDEAATGVVLGYGVDDIVRHVLAVQRHEKKHPFAVTEESHARLIADLQLPIHRGVEQKWFEHRSLSAALEDGWVHIRRPNGDAWRRNVSNSDDDSYWTYAMERPIAYLDAHADVDG